MRKFKILVIGLVAVLCLGGATMAVAGKTKKFKTTVSAKYKNPGNDPYAEDALFKGNVDSPKGKCTKKRKVVAKNKVTGSKIGSDLTNRDGDFRINASGTTDGKYTIKVKKKTFKGNGKAKNKKICKTAEATVKVKNGA